MPRLNTEVLKEYGLEMLQIYHDTTDRLLNPSLPVLQNTDGDPLIFCRVTYEITSARAAFDALRHLSLDHAEADLLADATLDDDGDVVAVVIPWLRRGNPKMPWQNTGLGSIRIDGQRLVVEVNSEQRAKLFGELADELLPAGCRHLSTVLESVEAALEAHRHDHPEGAEEDEDDKDLNNRPEVKDLLAKHLRAHYRAWPKMKLPALKGKTPLQAMKTPEGREMVEAVLLDLEQKAGSGPSLDPEISLSCGPRWGLACFADRLLAATRGSSQARQANPLWSSGAPASRLPQRTTSRRLARASPGLPLPRRMRISYVKPRGADGLQQRFRPATCGGKPRQRSCAGARG